RTPRATGRRTSTRWAPARPATTSRSCATGWRPPVGTRPPPARGCRRKWSSAPAPATPRPCGSWRGSRWTERPRRPSPALSPAMPIRALLLILVVCLVWAGNFLASAYALEEVPAFEFTALRMVILALVLAPFLKAPPKGQWRRLLAVALCNNVFHFGLSFWAL